MTLDKELKKVKKLQVHNYACEIVDSFNMDIKSLATVINNKPEYASKKKIKSEKAQKYFNEQDLKLLIEYSEERTKEWQIKRRKLLNFAKDIKIIE